MSAARGGRFVPRIQRPGVGLSAPHRLNFGEFDERHYRLDVHDHTAFRADSNKNTGPRFDPLRMVFDGKRVLDRQIQLDVATFRVSEEHATRIPIINARLLGLPGAPGPRVSIRNCLRASHAITASSRDASMHRVTLTIPESKKSPAAVLRLGIDEGRGWSVLVRFQRQLS